MFFYFERGPSNRHDFLSDGITNHNILKPLLSALNHVTHSSCKGHSRGWQIMQPSFDISCQAGTSAVWVIIMCFSCRFPITELQKLLHWLNCLFPVWKCVGMNNHFFRIIINSLASDNIADAALCSRRQLPKYPCKYMHCMSFALYTIFIYENWIMTEWKRNIKTPKLLSVLYISLPVTTK